MKKILGITLLIIVLMTGIVFAENDSNVRVVDGVELINIPEDVENEVVNPNARIIVDDVELINFPDDIENEITNPNARDEYESGMLMDDLYKWDENVTINEKVDSNVYTMGINVKIDGAIINGNLYVMGQNVEIKNSEITGTIYVMGQNVVFSGTANDIYALGEKITLEENSVIYRNAKIAGTELIVKGIIGRDLLTSVGKLSVGENAMISGTLKYISEEDVDISTNAKIGKVQLFTIDADENEAGSQIKKVVLISYIFNLISIGFKTLIVALIIIFFADKFKNINRSENIAKDLLKNTAKGFGYLVVVPAIAILLMISVIGAGFGIITLVLYMVALYVATAVTSVEIAQRVLSKKEEIKKSSLIGLSILVSIIIWAIGLIPVIGGIIKFLVILTGIGIIFSVIFKKEKKKEVINEN